MNSLIENTWNIVFEGKLLPGFDKKVVIKGMEQNFQIPRERLDYIFSGKRIVLKKNIPQSKIKEFDQKFKARGLAIEWEEEIPAPVILGEIAMMEKDKDDELLDRSNYSAYKAQSNRKAKVDKFQSIDYEPTYYDFTLLGRFGRISFINATLTYLILITLAIELIIINPALYELNKLFPLAIFFPFGLLVLFLIFRLAALRLYDLKFNEWLAILYVLSIINLFIVYFSRLGLFKQMIISDISKLVDQYIFYPSLLLFAVLFLFFSLVPGTKKKNIYGNRVKSGSIFGTFILFSIFILLEYYLKDDLALAELFEFRIDLSSYRLF